MRRIDLHIGNMKEILTAYLALERCNFFYQVDKKIAIWEDEFIKDIHLRDSLRPTGPPGYIQIELSCGDSIFLSRLHEELMINDVVTDDSLIHAVIQVGEQFDYMRQEIKRLRDTVETLKGGFDMHQ